MSILFALLGMSLGVIRDIARIQANEEERDFDPFAWLGERPYQILLRLLVTLGIATPVGLELANKALVKIDFIGSPVIVAIAVPFLIGLYGDKIQKSILEKIENFSVDIPIVRRLFTLGKELT